MKWYVKYLNLSAALLCGGVAILTIHLHNHTVLVAANAVLALVNAYFAWRGFRR